MLPKRPKKGLSPTVNKCAVISNSLCRYATLKSILKCLYRGVQEYTTNLKMQLTDPSVQCNTDNQHGSVVSSKSVYFACIMQVFLTTISKFAGEKPPHLVCMDNAEKYGSIFSLRLGQQWTVVLNGSATIKEALLKKGVEFANRPTTFTLDTFTEGGKDIVAGQYTQPSWKLHRKLVHSAFRSLATGNNEHFEKLVYSILPCLIKGLDEKQSEAFHPRPLLASSVYNILATMCFGKQYDFGSQDLIRFMELSQEFIRVTGNGLMADFIPILRHVPTQGVRVLKELTKEVLELINKEIKEHASKFDGGEPKDLIDMLFHYKEEMQKEGKEDMNLITDTHIRQTVADVFGAGTDTSIFTMHWSVMLLCEYPDVQEKVGQEVDRIVGRDRLPSLDDREKLTYTTAALYEVMRFSSIVPLSVPHATSKDVQLGGYTIPGGTWVLVNLYSMHYDEKLWDEPKKFKPEHFLDDTGEVRLHPDGFLPFSTGRRVCVGESVAKAELFLLFAWLFQHYRFRKAPGQEGKDYSESNAVAFGCLPCNYEVVVEKRI